MEPVVRTVIRPHLEQWLYWKVKSQQLFFTMEEDNFDGQLARHLFHSDFKKNVSMKARPKA